MKIFSHFKTIKDDPGKFILWILTSVILSLSTVWLPTLVGVIVKKDLFSKLILNNPFIVFSVVFLSNSVLTSINHEGAGSNRFAVNIRSITLIITILYLIFLSSIIPLKLLMDISLDVNLQFLILGITIFIGIYVYGFRESRWEESVDEIREQEEEDVTQITVRANNINNNGNDIQL